MCSLINKQLLLTAYAYLFIMEQQKEQQGSEALQGHNNKRRKIIRKFSNYNGKNKDKKPEKTSSSSSSSSASTATVSVLAKSPIKGATDKSRKSSTQKSTSAKALINIGSEKSKSATPVQVSANSVEDKKSKFATDETVENHQPIAQRIRHESSNSNTVKQDQRESNNSSKSKQLQQDDSKRKKSTSEKIAAIKENVVLKEDYMARVILPDAWKFAVDRKDEAVQVLWQVEDGFEVEDHVGQRGWVPRDWLAALEPKK